MWQQVRVLLTMVGEDAQAMASPSLLENLLQPGSFPNYESAFHQLVAFRARLVELAVGRVLRVDMPAERARRTLEDVFKECLETELLPAQASFSWDYRPDFVLYEQMYDEVTLHLIEVTTRHSSQSVSQRGSKELPAFAQLLKEAGFEGGVVVSVVHVSPSLDTDAAAGADKLLSLLDNRTKRHLMHSGVMMLHFPGNLCIQDARKSPKLLHVQSPKNIFSKKFCASKISNYTFSREFVPSRGCMQTPPLTITNSEIANEN